MKYIDRRKASRKTLYFCSLGYLFYSTRFALTGVIQLIQLKNTKAAQAKFSRASIENVFYVLIEICSITS